MKKRYQAALVAAALLSCQRAQGGTTSTYSVTVPANANQNTTLTRWYKLYVPSTGTGPAPLVILLHGGNQSYDRVINPSWNTPTQVWAVVNFNYWPSDPNNLSIADKFNVLIAVPNGIDDTSTVTSGTNAGGARYGSSQHWNDCSGFNRGFAPDANGDPQYTVDDVAFISTMIADIKTNRGVTVDPKRIFVAGASNGGNMALRLARELSGTIAAVGVTLAGDAAGPYASPTPDPLAVSDTCTNQNSQATPVPMWMYKGVADSFILYNGGCNNPSANKADGCWLPYEPGEPGNLRSNNVTTISRVLARYGLASAPTASGPIFYNMNNGSDAGGQNSTVSCTYHYGSGTVGTLSRSDVEDCRATFAGHVDPSITVHLSALTQGVLGYQNYDIEAAVEQWNFFQNHPLP